MILVKVLAGFTTVAGSLLGDKLTGLKGFAPTSLMQLLSSSSTLHDESEKKSARSTVALSHRNKWTPVKVSDLFIKFIFNVLMS